MVTIASEVCLGFGALLIIAGIVWLIGAAIQSQRQRPPTTKAGPTAGEGLNLTDLVKALTEFIKVLAEQSGPWRLIFSGVALLIIGAALSLAA
jgi:hypothetical protein